MSTRLRENANHLSFIIARDPRKDFRSSCKQMTMKNKNRYSKGRTRSKRSIKRDLTGVRYNLSGKNFSFPEIDRCGVHNKIGEDRHSWRVCCCGLFKRTNRRSGNRSTISRRVLSAVVFSRSIKTFLAVIHKPGLLYNSDGSKRPFLSNKNQRNRRSPLLDICRVIVKKLVFFFFFGKKNNINIAIVPNSSRLRVTCPIWSCPY